MRMKVIRDGSEDYEYLWLLREALSVKSKSLFGRRGKLTKARARELQELLDPVPQVCVSPTYFNQTPDAILERRLKLGHALDSLK